ncbi:MAG: hypothetical protein K8R11_07210 [Methanococcoides sp.]|jgi:hypothetical protein|nr:hypothetical protein [Methanococcoides sp.]
MVKRTVKRTTHKTTKKATRKATTRYVVTASITMRSGKLSKTTADKLKRDTKRKAPKANVTIRKI